MALDKRSKVAYLANLLAEDARRAADSAVSLATLASGIEAYAKGDGPMANCPLPSPEGLAVYAARCDRRAAVLDDLIMTMADEGPGS